jgi:hypothetical protein
MVRVSACDVFRELKLSNRAASMELHGWDNNIKEKELGVPFF